MSPLVMQTDGSGIRIEGGILMPPGSKIEVDADGKATIVGVLTMLGPATLSGADQK